MQWQLFVQCLILVPTLSLEALLSSSYKTKNVLGQKVAPLDDELINEDVRLELLNRTTLNKDSIQQYAHLLQTLNEIGRVKYGIDKSINRTNTAPDRVTLHPFLYQGDVILTPKQMKIILASALEDLKYGNKSDAMDLNSRTKRKLTSDLSSWWTSFPIPYYIDTATGVDPQAVIDGIQLWQQHTCVKFARAAPGNYNYIRFFKGNGCYSNIGQAGGEQSISVGEGCNFIAIVAHEIGHALGFYHEQTRFDRDNHIRIIGPNIQGNAEGQFIKLGRQYTQTFGYPYDLGSVMHYGGQTFSYNGHNTIETVDSNYQSTIGQRMTLSFYDAKFINTAYCNNVCPTDLPCQHNGYTDPKNCKQCRCSEPFGGVLCEWARQTTDSCGTVDLTAGTNYQTIQMSGRHDCNWVITAPQGRNVYIEVDTVRFAHEAVCSDNFLELRYGTDVANTGARFCSTRVPAPMISETNEAAVLFRGRGHSSFSLRFALAA